MSNQISLNFCFTSWFCQRWWEHTSQHASLSRAGDESRPLRSKTGCIKRAWASALSVHPLLRRLRTPGKPTRVWWWGGRGAFLRWVIYIYICIVMYDELHAVCLFVVLLCPLPTISTVSRYSFFFYFSWFLFQPVSLFSDSNVYGTLLGVVWG